MAALFELELEGGARRPTAARLYQRRNPRSPRPRRVASLEGPALSVLGDLFPPGRDRLAAKRAGRMPLAESEGVRLGLLFATLRPLSKPDRIWAVAEGVKRMADEEALYWFSRCQNGHDSGRARRALRILLAPE